MAHINRHMMAAQGQAPLRPLSVPAGTPALVCRWVVADDGRSLQARWEPTEAPWYFPARPRPPRRLQAGGRLAPRRAAPAVHPLLRLAA